jgi:hypothetical protein
MQGQAPRGVAIRRTAAAPSIPTETRARQSLHAHAVHGSLAAFPCGGSFNERSSQIMATTTTAVERIVRKVLNEEQDETVNAIRELSELLTEEVIPKLSRGPNGATEWDEGDEADQDEADQDTISPMSAIDAESPMGRRKKPSPNGHDDGEDTDAPEQPDQDVPKAVIDAFTSFYQSLSAEQSAALAELFTTIDGALDDQGADDSADEETGNEEERVHA